MKINNSSICEVRSVIRFINARAYNASEFRQWYETYQPFTMSEGKVRQWYQFSLRKTVQIFTINRSGRPKIWTDDPTEHVNGRK